MEKWHTIVSDDSGHEYVIPLDKETAWDDWLESEGAEFGEVPEWADKKEGHFIFKEYEV